jgi:hypothetical protein
VKRDFHHVRADARPWVGVPLLSVTSASGDRRTIMSAQTAHPPCVEGVPDAAFQRTASGRQSGLNRED